MKSEKSMIKKHHYKTKLEWAGNSGKGTSDYTSYERSYSIIIDGKAQIQGSSDPAFRGDASKHNPEELFLASISSCHMLWYLHLCSVNDVVVVDYKDEAKGVMEEEKNGSGRFTKVTLNPKVIVAEKEMISKAKSLHRKANEMCFIANSCNFEIEHEVEISIQKDS